MDKQGEQFFGYIKFFGPSVDEGKINAGKVGKSLVALEKLFNKYSRDIYKLEKERRIEIKVGGIRKNCTEVQIFFEQITPIAQPVAESMSALIIAKAIGATEFGKQFLGTIGQQLALKIFSKGKRFQEGEPFIKNQQIFIKLTNKDKIEKIILLEDWEKYKKLYPYSGDLIQLEKGEKIKFGYKENKNKTDVATVDYQEQDFFEHSRGDSIDERIKEPFDEEKAEEIKITGKFIDFYGLAHKYHFSFQARKKQDDIGKQKILCIVQESEISKIIDYLKPENSKNNITISGKATRDFENKVDKIKIGWINEDEDYNPNQQKIV